MRQDWNNSDKITREDANRPFWMASGVYNSGASPPRLELSITAGRVRFPAAQQVDAPNVIVYSGQAQRFDIDNPQDNVVYSIFVRPGPTLGDSAVARFIVSGSSLANFRSALVDAPRWDAEPIGAVYTGASISTANLRGPWNAGAFDPWDQRGEMPTVMASRRRMIYRGQTGVGGSINYADSTTVSGIGHVHFMDDTRTNGLNPGVRAFATATVRYLVSGARTSGTLYVTPTFMMAPMGGVNDGIVAANTHVFTVDQNPDDAVTRGARQLQTATVSAIRRNAGDGTGFSLFAGFRSASSGGETDAGVTPSIRIQAFDFIVFPGYYSHNITEPSD